MARVVLITPASKEHAVLPEGKSKQGTPPLGLLSLSSALKTHGHNVQIIDAGHEKLLPESAAEAALAFDPDIVGISSVTVEFGQALQTAAKIHSLAPDVRLVAGGYHVSARPDDALLHDFDAVIVGEGEEALPALLDYWEQRRPAPSSVVFEPGQRCVPARVDVNKLPPPDRNLIPLDHYDHPLTIIASRGCPRRCYFCSMTGPTAQYRKRELDDIFDEIDSLMDLTDHRICDFLDDSFLDRCSQLQNISTRLQERDLRWTAQGTVRDVLALGNELEPAARNLNGIFLGVESGDEDILTRLSKGFNVNDVFEASKRLLDLDLEYVIMAFILGHPWETQASLDRTTKMIMDLADRGVTTQISLLVPYPGTAIGDNPERFNVRIISAGYEDYSGLVPLVDIPGVTRDALQERFIEIIEILTSSNKANGCRNA